MVREMREIARLENGILRCLFSLRREAPSVDIQRGIMPGRTPATPLRW